MSELHHTYKNENEVQSRSSSVDDYVSPGTTTDARSPTESLDASQHQDQSFIRAFDPYDILLDRYEVIRSLGKGVSGSVVSLFYNAHSSMEHNLTESTLHFLSSIYIIPSFLISLYFTFNF